MEKEKILWAGVGIVSVISFVYFQRPTASRHPRHVRKGAKSERSQSRPRPPHTLTPGSKLERSRSRSTTAGRRLFGTSNATVAQTERRPGGLLDFTNLQTLSSPEELRQPQPKTQRQHKIEPRESEQQLTLKQQNALKQPKALEKQKRLELQKVPQRAGRRIAYGSQTDGIACNESDVISSISPIRPSPDDPASPMSAHFFSPGSAPPSLSPPPLPAPLASAVVSAIAELIAAASSAGAGAPEWIALHTFLADLPRRVRRAALAQRTDIQALELCANTARGAGPKCPTGMERLQRAVCQLARGAPAGSVRFRLSADCTAVLQDGPDAPSARFAHLTIDSSTQSTQSSEDSGAEGREAKEIARVERLLLERRRAAMPSVATQCGEESPLAVENVHELLGRIASLQWHAALGSLRGGDEEADGSLRALVADLAADAKRALESAARSSSRVQQMPQGTAGDAHDVENPVAGD